MSPAETTASQPIRLTVPRDIVLSNQYRSRARRSVLPAIRMYPFKSVHMSGATPGLRGATVVVRSNPANA